MKSILLAALFANIDALPPKIAVPLTYELKDMVAIAPIKTEDTYRYCDLDICEIFWDQDLQDHPTPPISPVSEPEDSTDIDDTTPPTTPPNSPSDK